MKRRILLLLVLAMLPQACLPDGKPVPHVRVDLVPEVSTVLPGSSFAVLLRQDIDEGWHTYWRNPGDSGAPPSITWQTPPGVSV